MVTLGGEPEAKFRFDWILEANYLDLGRDVADGVAALGVKVPVWTDLNEDEVQQGAEGKEDYRLEFTLSILF